MWRLSIAAMRKRSRPPRRARWLLRRFQRPRPRRVPRAPRPPSLLGRRGALRSSATTARRATSSRVRACQAYSPPLAGNATVKARDPSEHLRTILDGLQGKTIAGVAYSAVMPPFGPQLADADVAAVINHERSSWGNDAPLIQPEDVAAARRASPPAQAKASGR